MPDQDPRVHTTQEFAGVIRRLYPTLSAAEPDDNRLTHAVLRVHPELKPHVIDTLEGSEMLPFNPSTTKMVPRPIDPYRRPPIPQNQEPPPEGMNPLNLARFVGSPGQQSAPVDAVTDSTNPVDATIASVMTSPATGGARAARGVASLGQSAGPFVTSPGQAAGPIAPPGPISRARQMAGGAADVVGGALEAGTLLVPEALVGAPLEVGTGLLAGSAAAYGTEKAGEALGAPPEYVSLASELTGLIAGIGGAHVAGAPARATRRGIFDQLGAEDASARADVDFEHRYDERNMQAEFQAGNQAADDNESLWRVMQFRQEQANARATATLQAAFAENEKLHAAAMLHKQGQLSAGSPFEYMDNVRALPAPPSPAGLLGPGSPASFLAAPPEGLDPNSFDVTDPSRARPIATSGEPSYPGSPVVPEVEPSYTDRLGLQGGTAIDPALQESVDSFSRVPPTGTGAPPDRLALPAGDPAAAAGGGRRVIYGADPNARIETVGTDEPIVAQSAPPEPPLIHSLGEQLASQLEYQPQGGPPRPSPEMRVKFRERAEYKQAFTDTLNDAASQMEDAPYRQGRSVTDKETGQDYYVPHAGGAPIYWEIVGRSTRNPPDRSYIKAIVSAYAETGYEKGTHLPPSADVDQDANIMNRLRYALDLKTDGGVRRAYDEWIPQIKKAIDKEARRRAASRAGAGAEENVAADGGTGSPTEVAGPPPPSGAPPAGVSEDDLPEFLRNMSGDPTAIGGYEPGELAQRQGSQGPIHWGGNEPEDLPEPESRKKEGDKSAKFSELKDDPYDQYVDNLYGEDASAPTYGNVPKNTGGELTDEELARAREKLASGKSRMPLFERLAGEEGHLILNVRPDNRRGLKDWYARHEAEYGGEDWFQQGKGLLDDGDTTMAWRVAALASMRSAPAAVAGEAKDTAAASAEAAKARTFQHAKATQQALKDLGVKELPAGIDVNDAGVLTFGKPEHALRASATDLLMGRTLASDIIEAADPTQIFRIEGNTDPELRINRQIADQVIRSMPDEVIQPLLEITHVDSPEEFAKHFARTVSSWGRGLRMLKDWQDDHWADLVHIAQGGPGDENDVIALQSDIRTPSAFLTWLHTAATGDLDQIGFEYPRNIKPGTKDADTFAKSWFRKREAAKARANEAAKTVEDLAKDGSTLDRAMIAGALEPAGTKSRGMLDAVENTSRAFLISKPATMIRNLWTQGLRYGFDILDDAFSATYSATTLDGEGATMYMDRAVERLKGTTRAGNASTEMIKSPAVDSMEATYNYLADSVQHLPAEDIRKTIRLIDEFPRRAATYMGGLSLENGKSEMTTKIPGIKQLIDPRVRNVVTVLNRVQEMTFRGSIADSVFRAQLRDRGLDPSVELAGDPTQLIAKLGEKEVDGMIGASVAAALDGTFAAKPYPGSVPAMILNVFSNIPVLSPLLRMGMPFPRFNWVSAPRWLYDHSLVGGLLDPVLYNTFGRFGSENAAFKGRVWRGMEAQKMATEILPHLAAEIGKSQYTIAVKTQEFVQGKVALQRAAKEFKALERKAAAQGMLPEIHDDITRVGNDMQRYIQQGNDAKQAITDARTSMREQKKQQRNVEEKLLRIKEIGAPTWADFAGRQATGLGLMTAAYMIRSNAGDDTKWYEYKVSVAGEQHTLDLRAFAPMVQYLLPADVLHDTWKQTEWNKATAKDFASPEAAYKFLSKHYHGKYTAPELSKEIAAAFLSITPAAGSTSALIDYLTGRGGGGPEGIVQTGTSAVLGTIGQFLGRFTVPLQTISDVTGEFHKPAAQARIPESTTAENTHYGQEIFGPTIANIPEVRETIPPKVSPLTGAPIQTVHPFARALAGLTERDKSRIEDEITRTGIPYAKLVPRQVGDREFDNAVAEAYAEGLRKYAGHLLDNERYQAMSPELRRDLLGSAFGSLKLYAYQQAGKHLGLDAKSVHDKTTSPGVKNRIDRWKEYLTDLRGEAAKETPNAIEPPPEGIGGGAPPPS